MSGFAGLFRRSGEDVASANDATSTDNDSTPTELDAMSAVIAHRGPDGQGTWRDGPVGLCHRHLRTTPESMHDSLPRTGADGRHVLTMDARVDNRAELCEDLEPDDSSGITDSQSITTDSQLLLAAYDAWGTSCFERVVGAFAVALYDRPRRRLVCARDPMGIKPFYYALDGGLFAFGSEPKAILSLSDVPREIDEASVFAFLADEFEQPEATFFEGIDRLPPGHALVVEPDEARARSYWSPDPARELNLPSDRAYEQKFRELFTEAVRCRLRTPAIGTRRSDDGIRIPNGDTRTTPEVGAYLSGGLDSTSIACVAQSELGPEASLRTFSVTHDGYPESDESEYLDVALDAYDFDSLVRDAGGASPFPDLDRRLEHHDAPFDPPLFVMDALFSDEFRDADIRVLLDGLGGDQTLYYGVSYLPELLLGGRLGRFWSEFDAAAEVREQSRPSLAFEGLVRPLAPEPLRWAWRRFHGLDEFENRYPLLDAGAATAAGFTERTTPDEPPPADHREEHRRALVDPEQNFFFEVAAAARARLGVEPRYPFYDRRLVEFCLALPADRKMQDGLGRQIARRALRGTVPQPILDRRDKANFVPSWMDGLRDERERLRERLVESPRFVTRYFEEDALSDAYRQFVAEPSYREAWTLAKAYAVETWLRTAFGR